MNEPRYHVLNFLALGEPTVMPHPPSMQDLLVLHEAVSRVFRRLVKTAGSPLLSAVDLDDFVYDLEPAPDHVVGGRG